MKRVFLLFGAVSLLQACTYGVVNNATTVPH